MLKWQEVLRATPLTAAEGEEKRRITLAVRKKGCERSWVTFTTNGFRWQDRSCVPAAGGGRWFQLLDLNFLSSLSYNQ